jgi:elongation factor 1-beta
MGKVAVTLKIMPTGVDVDMDALEGRVRGTLGDTLHQLEVQPVAFGLKAIVATVVVDDAAGTSGGFEDSLRGLSDVESVETTDVSLV